MPLPEVFGAHLRNYTVLSCTPQYSHSLDDAGWAALQPTLSATFASDGRATTSTSSSSQVLLPTAAVSSSSSTGAAAVVGLFDRWDLVTKALGLVHPDAFQSQESEAARGPTSLPSSLPAGLGSEHPTLSVTTSAIASSSRRLPSRAGGYDTVTAPHRLLDWVPVGSQLHTARDPEQRRRVLAAAWAPSTYSTYGTGLLRWLLWCDRHQLPASAHFPALVGDVVDFVESVAGFFAGGTIRNWISGLRAWHTIHGASLNTTDPQLTTALRGADRLAPESSKKPPRAPFRIHHLWAIRQHLDMASSFDVSVWACLLTAFWGLARLGELVPKKGSFNKRYHPSAAHLSWEPTPHAPQGVVTGGVALPWTETKANGEKACYGI
ncbi:unnamed protein product [Tilletia caries]|nr:unnamed protein product [Tilletia caries]